MPHDWSGVYHGNERRCSVRETEIDTGVGYVFEYEGNSIAEGPESRKIF